MTTQKGEKGGADGRGYKASAWCQGCQETCPLGHQQSFQGSLRSNTVKARLRYVGPDGTPPGVPRPHCCKHDHACLCGLACGRSERRWVACLRSGGEQRQSGDQSLDSTRGLQKSPWELRYFTERGPVLPLRPHQFLLECKWQLTSDRGPAGAI